MLANTWTKTSASMVFKVYRVSRKMLKLLLFSVQEHKFDSFKLFKYLLFLPIKTKLDWSNCNYAKSNFQAHQLTICGLVFLRSKKFCAYCLQSLCHVQSHTIWTCGAEFAASQSLKVLDLNLQRDIKVVNCRFTLHQIAIRDIYAS